MLRGLLERSVTSLVRAACLFALGGLLVMCGSLVWPKALVVIFAMSVGHAIGFGAFACYLLAVIIDARRAGTVGSSAAPSRPSDAPASKT